MTQFSNQFKRTKEVGMLNLQLNPNIIDVKLNPFEPAPWDPSTPYFVGALVFNSIAGGGSGDDLFYIANANGTNEQPPDLAFWTQKLFPNVVPGTPVEAVPLVSSSQILVQTLSDITNGPLGFVIRDVKNPINESDFSSDSPNRDIRGSVVKFGLRDELYPT